MHSKIGWAVGTALLAGVAATSADAMPLAPMAEGLAQPALTLVRDGCGPNGFRGRFGECRYRRGGYLPAPGFYGVPRIFGGGGYGYGRRCFIRETYYGPRRVCRY